MCVYQVAERQETESRAISYRFPIQLVRVSRANCDHFHKNNRRGGGDDSVMQGRGELILSCRGREL
jgi:hypothetical protein